MRKSCIPYKISKFWFLRLGNIANAIYKNFYYTDEFNYFNEKVGRFNLQFKFRNIELFCIADRIEVLQQENIARIIDFKSGYIPNANEVAKGLYPQLPIEKYIFINNGFDINMCAGHDVRVEGSSPSWADIERSIS